MVVAGSVGVAVTLADCGSLARTAKAPSCHPARPPEYPTTAATLTDLDAGGTWCVTTGITLVVQLHAPPGQSDTTWSPVTSSNANVLEPVSNAAVTLPRGITASFLAARRAGVVTLNSERPDGSRWTAVVVVAGA